ncbi:MAG: hypothetical protein HYU53_03610 [Acidobacteria bacterium]|nr:hypothetical protein [Acidobacteriota bacterium]
MTGAMRHPIRGLLVGPLAAPIGYWAGVVVLAWTQDYRLGLFRALQELVTIAAFALPIAYAVTLAWGVPVLFALRSLGWLRAAPLIGAGAIGGTIVAMLIASYQRGSLIQIRMSLPAGAAIGALVAGTTWWAGQDRT